jgi:hypothetical protein
VGCTRGPAAAAHWATVILERSTVLAWSAHALEYRAAGATTPADRLWRSPKTRSWSSGRCPTAPS